MIVERVGATNYQGRSEQAQEELRQWFVIGEDYHKGPFTPSELINLYESEKIDGLDFIWKEGETDYIKVKDCTEVFSKVIPPPTPEVSIKADPPPIPIYAKKLNYIAPVIENKDLGLPPLPGQTRALRNIKIPKVDEIAKKIKKEAITSTEGTIKVNLGLPSIPKEKVEPRLVKRESPKKVKVLNDKEVFKKKEVKLKQTKRTQKEEGPKPLEINDILPKELEKESMSFNQRLVMTFLFILAITSSSVFIYKLVNKPVVYRGVSLEQASSLNKIVKLGSMHPFQIGATLSKSGNSIVLASNFGGNARINVIIKSLEGKILSTTPIEIHTTANLSNNTVKLDNLKFINGNALRHGHYEISVQGIKNDAFSNILHFFKSRNMLNWLGIVRNFSRRLSFVGTVLLATESKAEFNERLVVYKKKLKKKKLGPLINLKQKYSTLLSLLIRMDTLYSQTISTINYGRYISKFERSYAKEIAPVLTGLILEGATVNNRVKSSLKEKKENLGLHKFGRRIGLLASDMVTHTKKWRTLPNHGKKKLLSYFNKRVENMKMSGKSKIRQIDGEIKTME